MATIERIKRDLRGWQLNRALFVADSGMKSSENRKELARACGNYLLATRMATVAEVKQEVLARSGRYTAITDNLQAKEVVIAITRPRPGGLSSCLPPNGSRNT